MLVTRDQAYAIADGHVLYAFILFVGYLALLPRVLSTVSFCTASATHAFRHSFCFQLKSEEQDPSRQWLALDRMKLRLCIVFFCQTVRIVVIRADGKILNMRTVFEAGLGQRIGICVDVLQDAL